jgi:hypothetical protein
VKHLLRLIQHQFENDEELQECERCGQWFGDATNPELIPCESLKCHGMVGAIHSWECGPFGIMVCPACGRTSDEVTA